MKKLLYILPLALLLFSCAEEPTKVIEEGQFRTVYGLERSFENGQIAGVIGDLSKNSCTSIDTLSFSTYPNPTAFGITIDFFTDSKRTFEIFLETAQGDKELLDSLGAIRYPSPISIPQHDSYFKTSLTSGSVEKGNNSVHLDLEQFETGIYYLIYEDSEGNKGCYPLAVQRYLD